MAGILKLNSDLLAEAENHNLDHIIPGLSKGEYGFIIGSPGTGKGYFCLSLAYELTSSVNVVGLKSHPNPIKVLYWPVEEKRLRVLKRIKKHMRSFSSEVRDSIFEHLSLYDNYEPICAPMMMYGTAAYEMVVQSKNQLIEAAKDVDLLIIDTVREAVGACKEVDNDLEIKLALQEIAEKSDTAILVTHHPTKDITKRKELITSVAGSGLSLTQATSRYALYLEEKGSEYTNLTHTKHNNVEQAYVQRNTKLHWTTDSLVHNPEMYLTEIVTKTFINDEDLKLIDAELENPIKPSSINLSKMKIPVSELKRTKQLKDELSMISDDEKAKYKEFLKQQKNK
ncbi:MAG: AAA family ATPase [Thalassotalea sp.]|nr:AAA family ATPase [Thalassotalea sp.]